MAPGVTNLDDLGDADAKEGECQGQGEQVGEEGGDVDGDRLEFAIREAQADQ